MRRIAVLAVALLFLAACGGSSKVVAKSAPTASASVHARPLAVLADGIVDPNNIDLSGIAGVTPAQQKKAEDLLRRTILTITKWSDVDRAKADGFVVLRPLNLGSSGIEHYVRWDWIDDGDIFDPNKPESLVYRVDPNGKRTLEAAMYILPKTYRLDNVPDLFGKLVQFHVHEDLCFTNTPVPKFLRVARLDGSCIPPLVKLLTNPMMHVWIRPNPCGPFAPVAGFESGTVENGQKLLCDRVHGGPAD